MRDSQDINELMNCYIDGELNQRQQTELQRLIKHDREAARQLQRLQKCKLLLGAMGRAEAPPEMLERIKTSLQTKQIMGERYSGVERREGVATLWARRLVTTAAMVVLLAVLGAVVYTILSPEDAPTGVAVEEATDTSPTVLGAADPFYGTLRLRTAVFAAADSSINKALADNGISADVSQDNTGNRTVYTLTCTPNRLKILLADLGNVWGRLDSAELVVETDEFGRQVVVADVLPEQVCEIADTGAFEARLELAGEYAGLNTIRRLTPGKEVFAAIADKPLDLTVAPPKPLITGGGREALEKPPTTSPPGQQAVHLTIVVER